jgi:hypothetical protein
LRVYDKICIMNKFKVFKKIIDILKSNGYI